MNRVLVGTTNSITAIFLAGEDPIDADGAVSVTVEHYDGTSVETGTATHAGVGTYTYVLPSQSDPGFLRVRWSGEFSGDTQEVIQEYEAVAAFLFPLSELRAMDGLGDETTYPTTELSAVRDAVTDLFTEYTRTAFGETWAREVLDGDGSTSVILHYLPLKRVLSIKVNGAARTATAARLSGLVDTSSALTTGAQNVVVEYVYGRDTVPGDVKRAALKLARSWLLESSSSIPDRARMMTTQWGTFQLANATEDYPTGIPEVDSVLNRYSMRMPGFA